MKKSFMAKIFAALFIFAMPFVKGMQIVEGEGEAGVTDEEKALLSKIENKVKSLTHNLTVGLISETLFNQKMAELQTAIDKVKETTVTTELKTAIDEIKEMATKQGIEISAIKQMSPVIAERKTLLQGVKEFLENADIKAYIENGAKGQSIRVKTLVDMTMATAVTRPITPYTQLLGGLPVYAPERKISMTDVIPVGTTESETVTFNQEYEFEDGVTTLTENQATGKSSFKLRPSNLTAGRIGTHLIVSKRMLKNTSFLMAHISNRIPQKIKKAEDTEILNGDGSGSRLVGLMQNASTFAAGTFAGYVHGAQEIDALSVAISQLTQGEYQASGIVLNPIDATKIELIKTTTHEYTGQTKALRGSDGVLRISGIPVIETTAMTAGNFLVGDLKMACEWLLFTPLTMSISDTHASLFLSNEVCINFEEEPVFPIYNPLMFVKGVFATAIAAIDAGS